MLTNYIKIAIIFSALLLATFYSCSENKGSGSNVLDPNGLTKDINDIVPDSLLQIIKSLGMPVYTGDSPPSIEGAFEVKPFILDSSNVPGDWSTGTQFSDYYLNFRNQNNADLTVNVDYQNGPELGTGIGSYIVGKNGDFSVFSKVTTTVGLDSAYILVLYSGSKQSDGIHDIYVALFMLDDLSDPSNYFIENGNGRVFYDLDGLSLPIIWGFSKPAATKAVVKPAFSEQK